MSAAPVARVVVRRRAVVAGRAVDASGKPVDAARLSLRDALDPTARVHACHVRRDGGFFFLDVPPGRYALNRADAAGAVEHSTEVVVPQADREARPPLVSVVLDGAKQRKRT